MLWVVRLLCLLFFGLAPSVVGARNLYILVIGEGAAANCNDIKFSSASYVMQIGIGGAEKAAEDPFEWSECNGGSFWIPLGEQLHSQGLAQRIVFMPVTVEKAKVADWLGQGDASRKLGEAIKVARQRDIRFDYVLVQQGSSDRESKITSYFNDLQSLVNYVRVIAPRAKWIFARGTACRAERSLQIERVQTIYGQQPLANHFVGPVLAELPENGISKNCMLNRVGQLQMAYMWANAIHAVETDSERYRKEALLYYFQ